MMDFDQVLRETLELLDSEAPYGNIAIKQVSLETRGQNAGGQ